MYDCWSVPAVGVQQKAVIMFIIIIIVVLHIAIIGEAVFVFHKCTTIYLFVINIMLF